MAIHWTRADILTFPVALLDRYIYFGTPRWLLDACLQLQFSRDLNRLYAQMGVQCPIRFKLSRVMEGLVVRAVPIYKDYQHRGEAVHACHTHSKSVAGTNVPRKSAVLPCHQCQSTCVVAKSSLIDYDTYSILGWSYIHIYTKQACLNRNMKESYLLSEIA